MCSDNQVHVSRDLIRYIKKLQKKTSHLNGCKRLENKIKNRISDVKLLHSLSVVRLCKRLLAEDPTIESKNGNRPTQEDRLIMRLRSSRPVAAFVQSFRENHKDWMSLVHYLFYKNISGKWKSREQKSRNRKVRGSLPLPPAPVQKPEEATSQEESYSSSAYRINNETEESKNSTKSLTVTSNPFSDDDVLSDADSDLAEMMITQLLEQKGIKKCNLAKNNSSLSSKEKVSPPIDGIPSKTETIKSKMIKSKDLNSAPNASHVKKKQISSPSLDENQPKKLKEDPLFEELDDLLGDDDKEVRKSFKNKTFKNQLSKQSKGSTISSRRIPKRHDSTKFPNKIKPNSLQMHKTTPPVSTAPISSELTRPGLHPSWEAKRLEKAKIVNISKGPPPEAKRIVFDD
ncbi:unnamed protein product [Trichobilharzia szidati]|nr:unnamed protein product [Trichobilharzia szidati]